MNITKDQKLEISEIKDAILTGICDEINTEMDTECKVQTPSFIPDNPYSTEITRLHNKSFAPKGGVYLVIRYTDSKNRMKYQSALLVRTDIAFNNALKQAATSAMWQKLKSKYDL